VIRYEVRAEVWTVTEANDEQDAARRVDRRLADAGFGVQPSISVAETGEDWHVTPERGTVGGHWSGDCPGPPRCLFAKYVRR
jgi:hypothetical protein